MLSPSHTRPVTGLLSESVSVKMGDKASCTSRSRGIVESPRPDERLSRIATQWSMVFAAHGSQGQGDDRHDLMARYSGAAYRYLLGAVRDAEVAEDLCQEFALRFLRGDFRRATPQRGRFRDYLKTSLVNLVNDYWNSRVKKHQPLVEDVAQAAGRSEAEPGDQEFLDSWRCELLDRTWQALLESRPNYHAVLLLRVENPDLSSQEMATALTVSQPTPYNAALVRKTLERAHARFADLLLEEVATSLSDDDPDRLADELQELDLLKYCRVALERRVKRNP